ncbi:unannotated protein [freshwater metagenome]|uniref:Unannotated protein n=1 Tax=freshwater metagenome TaxID=449393 RepID=A0A6J6SS06_9ZZZZ
MQTSNPCVSWAISVRLCTMRAAIVPRMPLSGMIDALSWPGGRMDTELEAVGSATPCPEIACPEIACPEIASRTSLRVT